MSILLSICIPTYNREKYIGETLATALSQQTPEVEVVVCDNASSDGTEAVVQQLFAGRSDVRYFRWERNMGADRNFIKVIEIATGKYCWFMGSDDIIEPGSVAHLLSILKSSGELTGLSVNRNAYSVDMKARILERPVAGGQIPENRVFHDATETFMLLGEYFGYLPGQIVNRERWNRIVTSIDVTPYFNAYVHVFIISKMLQADPAWMYISRACAGWRSGNDSFLSEGRLKRLAIDIIGLEKITRDVFGKGSAPYRMTARTIVGVHVFYAILGAKVHGASLDFLRKAFSMCLRHYWNVPTFWFKTCPLFLTPRFVLLGLQSLYRGTLKRARLARLR